MSQPSVTMTASSGPITLANLPGSANIPAGTPTANANAAASNINEIRGYLPTQFEEPWAKTITLTSGYRTEKENFLAGGKKNSKHLVGSAVDFQLGPEATPQDYLNVYNKLKQNSSQYSELFIETKGGHTWIHVATKTDTTQSTSTGFIDANTQEENQITEAEFTKATSSQVATSSKIEEGLPSSFVPLRSNFINTQSAENDRSLFIPEGLDSRAWYDDPDLLVGNPHKKVSMKTDASGATGYKEMTPVSFTLNLREFSTPLYASKDKPLTLKLNCSMDTFTLGMKHILNKTNTRTGFHMTFWGMEPDTITGSGSTGVFLNQWGVTDLMSLEDNSVGFDLMEQSGATIKQEFTGRGVEPFRVAAQDAFVELLALFRNNGITRYKKDNYTIEDSITINRDQVQQSVWSEKYGDSAYTRNARNNDVMVKGNVTMKFKSNSYHGYFKSLQWTMDADNPFQWKFEFTFQVQRTVSFVFYPKV